MVYQALMPNAFASLLRATTHLSLFNHNRLIIQVRPKYTLTWNKLSQSQIPYIHLFLSHPSIWQHILSPWLISNLAGIDIYLHFFDEIGNRASFLMTSRKEYQDMEIPHCIIRRRKNARAWIGIWTMARGIAISKLIDYPIGYNRIQVFCGKSEVL